MVSSRVPHSTKRSGATALAGLALGAALALAGPARAANLSDLALPGGPVATDAVPLSLTPGRTASARVDPSLLGARGSVEVWVKLADRPLAEARGQNAKTRGGALSLEQRRAYLRSLDLKHGELSLAAGRMGAAELGRVSRAHNAVALRIDASRIADLASLPGVVAVRPVRNYELALSETVPYVGAAAAQAAGQDGTGARVAVLDSGIDYTHRNLGGPGTPAAYAAAQSFPNPYFPSGKVVGGFDFVGNKWPGTPANPEPRTEDPNPIDDGAGGGHGTHVSDIVAGRSADGTHVGVAPGAQLYAIKVCSSVSTSCSGVALLKGVDFALDPNGDGSMSDAVDVMNLSLGSNYGQQEDDLSEALNQAVSFGVVVVAAAGNAGNRPFIVSSPSTATRVISVAQTQVPSARAFPLVVNSPAAIAATIRNTETVGWAPIDRDVTADVAFVGRGCPAGSISPTNPDDPYQADPAGKIALIDRGACAVSLKVDRAAKAGALGVVLGLVAPGDPISFSFGGGTTFVPTLIITQADSNRIKAQLTAGAIVNATISPAAAIPLVGSMVSSSARGPSVSFSSIKPEIGAPGASVSAQFATGNGETAFGGTSGATPMVAGSAAILVGAIPGIEPMEVKARLMNTAETQIFHNPALLPGTLAAITRIGAGEVRVNKALSASSAAWVGANDSAALSFGYHAVSRTAAFEQRVRVRNLGNQAKTFAIASSFRYPGKAGNAAVEVRHPSSVRVGARGTQEVLVTIVVHPESLPFWNINGGSQGGNGARLDGLEVDGYLSLTSGGETLSLPWQVLPHRAAALRTGDEVRAGGFLNVFNTGAADGTVEVFALTGRSSRIPQSQLPLPGQNFAVIDLRAVGARAVSAAAPNDSLQIGISTNGARAHPNYPAEFDVYIDANRDGAPDFVIFNAENGGFGVSGQNVVFVFDLSKPQSATNPRAFFFTDADLQSSNAILTAPLAAMGMTADTQFDFVVAACDNYFTGLCTDAIGALDPVTGALVAPMTFTPSRPRFAASTDELVVPVQGVDSLSVTAVAGGAQASPSQTGFLLLFRDSDPRQESQAVRVEGSSETGGLALPSSAREREER